MGDTNESSSETDHIRIIDISDFPDSPHLFNKKAYKFTLAVFGATNYRERIGFNLYPLPSGHYTMVAEFFPPVLRNVSVTAAIGAGSISGQVSTIVQPHGSTRRYVKILVQLENVRTGLGTNHIYFDLHGDLLQEINLDVRMVVYGVNGVLNVPSSVSTRPMSSTTDGWHSGPTSTFTATGS